MDPFLSGKYGCLNLDDTGSLGAEGSHLLVFLGWEAGSTASLVFEFPDPYRGSVAGLSVLLRIPEGAGQPLPWSWVLDFRFQSSWLCEDCG